MNRPKVSIIVPVYNVEEYLPRCVNSLLNQTLKDIEIVLVDDKSPDGCAGICDKYALDDKRINVIHKLVNEGLGLACNSGMCNAKGDYVAFCDSDDWVDPGMYKTLYDKAIENNADVVFSTYRTLGVKGTQSVSTYKEQRVFESKEDIDSFLLDMIASEPSCSVERRIQMSAKVTLYKSDFINGHNIRFESERNFISEDLIWHIDVLAHANKICVIPDVMYNYCNNNASLSKRVRVDRFSFFIRLRDEVIERCAKYDIRGDVSMRANRLFIGYCRAYIRQIYNSSLSRAEKKRIVEDICSTNLWNEIWKSYPISRMPIKHMIMAWLMQKKAYFMMRLICKYS